MTGARWRALAVTWFIVASGEASGSQYPLDQIRTLIPRREGLRLRAAGIRTTLDLLTYGRTLAARRVLAERTLLPQDQIDAWVALADLMRIRGIGPDVARLLTAVGVRTIADLQRAEAVATGAAIREMNRTRKLSTNPPGPDSISYWITQARTLPIVLE